MLNHLAADAFSERRKTLEDAFFKAKDHQLLEWIGRRKVSFADSDA